MLKVLINLPVLERIKHYIDLARGEVSCLGTVERDGDNLVVTDLFLPKQVCSGASTEMDPADVAKLLVDLEQQGIDPKTLRLWLHSHADMNTFWSQTDADTIKELINDGFLLSIVTNKKGAMLARVDVFEPIAFTIDKLPVEPLLPDFGLRDQCKAEIEAKVQRAVLPPVRVSGNCRDDVEEVPLLLDDMAWAHEQMELDRQLQDGEITFMEYLERADGVTFP